MHKLMRFNYPSAFKSLPDYTAHAGQIVEVIRQAGEADGVDVHPELELMYCIKSADGWAGYAWESELEEVLPNSNQV